jgi:hypothetical protein
MFLNFASISNKIGLFFAISLTSFALISCDGDSSSSDSSPNGSDSGPGFELDGVFSITDPDDGDVSEFRITDVDSKIGSLTLILDDGPEVSIKNLNFAYDDSKPGTFTIIDNRVTDEEAIAEINRLVVEAGPVKDAFDALNQFDPKVDGPGEIELFEALEDAINEVTAREQFIVEEINEDLELYIIKEISYSPSKDTDKGILIKGDNPPFTLGDPTEIDEKGGSEVKYTAP